MPYGYTSGASEESSGRSYSTSGSRQRSSSEGGERYTPEQEGRINQLYADISSRLAQMGQPGDYSRYLSTVGGPAVPFSPVTAGNVYTPDALQQQVNLMRGQNDARSAAQIRQMQDQMAGRGYSGQSPLAMALQAGYLQQALASSSQGENQLRFDAQRANADQLLRQQIADVQRASLENQAGVNRRSLALSAQGQDYGREGTLLSALGQYNQPLRFDKSDSLGESYSFSSNRNKSRSSRSSSGSNSSMRQNDYDTQF